MEIKNTLKESKDTAKKTPFLHLEKLMIIVGIVGPFAMIPQLIKLYFTHSHHVEGQSLITWSLYTLFSSLWLIYALGKKDVPLYISSAIATLFYFLMAAGIIIFADLTF